jgi:hypothetical protein
MAGGRGEQTELDLTWVGVKLYQLCLKNRKAPLDFNAWGGCFTIRPFTDCIGNVRRFEMHYGVNQMGQWLFDGSYATVDLDKEAIYFFVDGVLELTLCTEKCAAEFKAKRLVFYVHPSKYIFNFDDALRTIIGPAYQRQTLQEKSRQNMDELQTMRAKYDSRVQSAINLVTPHLYDTEILTQLDDDAQRVAREKIQKIQGV